MSNECLPLWLDKFFRRFSARGEPSPLFLMMWPDIVRWRWVLLGVLLLLPLSAFVASVPTWLTKIAIDDYLLPAIKEKDLSPYRGGVLTLTSVAISVVLLDYMIDAIYLIVVEHIMQNILASMRSKVFAHTLRLPRSYFDKHPIGSVLTRVTSDIEILADGFSTQIMEMVVKLLKMMAFLIAMFLLNARLTVVLFLILPMVVLVIILFRVRVRTIFYETHRALAYATGWLHECLAGVKALQLFRTEHRARHTFKVKSERFLKAQNVSIFYDSALYASMEFFTVLSIAAVLAVGAIQLKLGILSLGVLVAFVDYIQKLFLPLKGFSQQIALFQHSLASLSHISGICDQPIASCEVINPDYRPIIEDTGVFQSLEFKDVKFSYREDGEEVLKGVSFVLHRGQNLAIVGATGAGKSSIVKLLMQAYDGYRGEILINGRELRKFSADEINRLMAVVHQDVFLFQGSVAFNIGMGKDVSMSQLKEAAQYAQVDPFINKLEEGYQNQVRLGADNFSAGQKQLFSLARAVAWKSELIVLDEATSAVDSITEQAIQKAVQNLFQDRTVIAIAHRLSTIRKADNILMIHQGRIAESGTHQQLMKKGGRYARLVNRMRP